MLSGEKRYDEALRVLGRALEIAPRHVPTLVAVARAQTKKASYQQAEQAIRAALAIDPHHAMAHATLGEIHLDNDRFTEALAAFEAALARAPDSWETRNLYANCLKAVGRLDEALAEFERTLSDNPRAYGCYANMSDLVAFTPESPHFAAMERILADAAEPDSAPYTSLHFAIGKAYDDVGDHEKAIAHWRTGATLRRKELDYDEAETAKFFAGITESYGADYFANPPFEGNPSAVPVFIIGMPRSGSTLVEQILTSHPLAHGGGETKELSRRLGALRARFPGLPRYPELGRRMNADQHRLVADGYLSVLQAMNPAAERITDKLLTNYYFVGLLHVLFPNARFINTVRNPVDTCLSCYSKLFRDDMPHSYDFGELGRYYLRYQALMDHWQRALPAGTILPVRYEDLVADVETHARRLIAFIGMPWDPACLAFHESSRPVKTASVVQVRQPVYQTSVERWRRYGAAIRPLVDALCVNEDTVPGISAIGTGARHPA
jgi:tetratricopeptide (TPR) repeat protein